jgi:sirohydrochlorin cobaltochelatase
MSEQPAILICSHGSRDKRAVAEFGLVEQALRQRFAGRAVASGYLEFARPSIAESLSALTQGGAREIWALPGMLFAAMHMKTDIPEELDAFSRTHPDVALRFGAELGLDWRMLEAAKDRIETALKAADEAMGKVPRRDTLLVVVGRGTSDPDANGNIAKVARMLWDVMGFGWVEAGFSGLAQPTADVVMLRELQRDAFRRVLVFPYFLFTGILVDRIYDWADAVADRFPEAQVVKVPYLKDHPRVIDTFVERLCDIERDAAGTADRLTAYRDWLAAGKPLEGEPWMKKAFDDHHDHGGECGCGHTHEHHPHDEHDCGCGHAHEHEHDEHECCGGHDHDDDHECCGGHHHEEDHGHGGCGCGGKHR